eukprot:sb/3476504/
MMDSRGVGCSLLKDADDEGFLSSEEIKSDEDEDLQYEEIKSEEEEDLQYDEEEEDQLYNATTTGMLSETATGAAVMLLPLSGAGMDSHEMSVIPRDDKMLLVIMLESSWTYMVSVV